MLFTHFGVSGPVLLSASSFCAKAIRKRPLRLVIDLKPALSWGAAGRAHPQGFFRQQEQAV